MRYINEPWIADESYEWYSETLNPDPDPAEDNVRIWIPLDLNRAAIVRRLRYILDRYGEITWRNEAAAFRDTARLGWHIEKYDQYWMEREKEPERKHSKAAVELVKELIGILEEADCCCDFPEDIIQDWKTEYL